MILGFCVGEKEGLSDSRDLAFDANFSRQKFFSHAFLRVLQLRPYLSASERGLTGWQSKGQSKERRRDAFAQLSSLELDVVCLLRGQDGAVEIKAKIARNATKFSSARAKFFLEL